MYKYIGKRIRSKRIAQGFTQEQIAEAAKISPSYYGHIERGTRKMSLKTFFQIAEALGCSADELSGFYSNPKRRASAKELLSMAEEMAALLNEDAAELQKNSRPHKSWGRE